MDDAQQNFYKLLLLILTSIDFGIDTRHIKFPLITQQESHTTSCNRNFKCLKQGRKISDICLKQGQGMRGRAAPPHTRIYRVPPPPPRAPCLS